MSNGWIAKPGTFTKSKLCKIGLHAPGDWKTSVEPDFYAEVTLVVKRRYCQRCKVMQMKEVERHG